MQTHMHHGHSHTFIDTHEHKAIKRKIYMHASIHRTEHPDLGTSIV